MVEDETKIRALEKRIEALEEERRKAARRALCAFRPGLAGVDLWCKLSNEMEREVEKLL